MDTLNFLIEESTDDINPIRAIPIINSKPLLNLVKHVESTIDKKLAGQYVGMHPKELFESYQSLKNKSHFFFNVLGCSCGETECWPLEVEVIQTEKEIIWKRFFQPHRPLWNYSKMPKLRFDKVEYCSAFEGLSPHLPHKT